MKIYYDLKTLQVPLKYPVVTIGSFDGLHKGHQKILQKLVQLARKNQGESFAITFWPHPRQVLKPRDEHELLLTLDEKISFFKETGIQHLVIVRFDLNFAKQSYQVFFNKTIISKFQTRCLVVGYDHAFGKNREGNLRLLENLCQKSGIRLFSVAPIKAGAEIASSTRIRYFLKQGKIEEANRLLGYGYFLEGPVVRGAGQGQRLGFPTLNFKCGEKLIPSSGVYATRVEIKGQSYAGALNIGYAPTLGRNHFALEVHIIHPRVLQRPKMIRVIFLKRIRAEKKFETINQLKNAIRKDVRVAQFVYQKRGGDLNVHFKGTQKSDR